MRDWIVQERNVTWLEDIFDANWLPSEALQHFTLRRKSHTQQLGIEVPGYVGVIGLKNGDRLRIEPKYPTSFMSLLAVCYNINLERIGLVQASQGNQDASLQLIIRSFIKGLAEINSNGALFTWKKGFVTSSFGVSDTDWTQTLIRVKQHSPVPFAGKQTQRIFDTPERRVLSFAARKALNEVENITLSKNDSALVNKFIFDNDHRHIQDDLRAVSERLASDHYHGQRSYYAQPLRMALILLGFNGITYESKSDFQSEGFLVNSDDLFEEWVRVKLRSVITEECMPYSVQKERRNNKQFFIDKNYYLIPDVLIYLGANIVAIGDAKNKTPSIDDFYQMFTYINMYKQKRGIIIAADGGPGLSVEDSIEELHAREGLDVTINVYHLDMSNMEKCDELFRRAVHWLF